MKSDGPARSEAGDPAARLSARPAGRVASGGTSPDRTNDTAWTDLLGGIVAIASEERSLRAVLRQTARLVVAAAGADACFVHIADQEAKEVVLMGATPDSFDELAGTIRLPFGDGIAGWVAEHGEPAIVDDKWSDPRYHYIPALRGEEYASLVSVPLLRSPGVAVGVLNVHARPRGHFSPGVLSKLEEVAALLAGIVDAALLHEQLRLHEEQLERFTVRTIELQELERRRIAGDIHDGISQRLVSAWYHLKAAGSLTKDPAVRDELEESENLVSDALDEARRAISGLRPYVLDDLGLTAAITSLASNAGDFEVELDLEECDLPPHVETSLYRIAQEALQNVVKHAGATRVKLLLHTSEDGVTLSVADNGSGFDTSSSSGRLSFGLIGMRERASLLGASFHVHSRPAGGTTLVIELPPSMLEGSRPAVEP
ncbi:MAG: GAF domain-containing sensor histidine kinase [Acidimicrobiales bacterium]